MLSLVRLVPALTFVALLFCLGFGFVDMLGNMEHKPWTDQGVRRLVVSILSFAAVAALVEWRAHRFAGLVYLGIGLLVATASVGFSPVFAALLYLLSALVLGDAILQKLPGSINQDGLQPLLATMLGLCVSVTILAPVIRFEIHYPAVYLIALSLPFALHRDAIGVVSRLIRSYSFTSDFSASARIGRAGMAVLAFLYLFVSLLPEANADALTMHLMIPAHVSTHHAWPFDVTRHVWAVMPMGGDWVYTYVYMLGGEYGARLMNFALLMILVQFIQRATESRTSSGLARLAAVLFLSTPLVLTETSSLFIENFQACLLVGGFISVARLWSGCGTRYAWVAAALLGTALAVKSGSFAFVPVPFAIALGALYRLEGKNAWKPSLGFIAIFVGFGAFPYANALVTTGNPIFPFSNAYFQSPLYDTTVSFVDKRWREGISFDTLYRATFDSGSYLESLPGALGFSLIVLLPLALLFALVNRRAWVVQLAAVATAFVITVFIATAYLRYIYPSIPLFFMLIAAMLHYAKRVQPRLYQSLVVFSIASIVLNLAFLSAGSWRYRDFRLDLALDPEKREEHLRRRLPTRWAIQYLNLMYGDKARVAFHGTAHIAELEGVPITANWHNYQYSTALLAAKSEDDYLALFEEFDLTHFLVYEAGPDTALPAIHSITRTEQSFGHYTLRRVTGEARAPDDLSTNGVRVELLENGDFRDGVKGWSGGKNVAHSPTAHTVTVSAVDHLAQLVDVDAAGLYRLTVTARCLGQGGQFRLQVNWHAANGQALQRFLVAKPCMAEFASESVELTAPDGAIRGAVFAAGHSDSSVEIDRISLTR